MYEFFTGHNRNDLAISFQSSDPWCRPFRWNFLKKKSEKGKKVEISGSLGNPSLNQRPSLVSTFKTSIFSEFLI